MNACVTIHMAASLDGFVARRDGRVDWMATSDRFDGGETLTPEAVRAYLASIDCYLMGSHTYETALAFEASGQGWAYGDTPTVVLTTRTLPKARESVEFCAGDLGALLQTLRSRFRSIWVVGGSAVAGECLRRGLADEVRYSVLPIVIGDGIPFFGGSSMDAPLHLLEVTTYDSGIVALRYEIRR